MINLFYDNIIRLENLTIKYPTKQALIEELYLKGIIEAYNWIKDHDESIEGLLENHIRNKFTHHFKHHNSLLKEHINNKTIVLTKENAIYTSHETERTDIELISSGHRDKFVVECKRLSSAETRYVHGATDKEGVYQIDGMEKFIKLIYSEDDNYAGMISFIINGTPERILNTLKLKVKDFRPSNEIEQLIDQKCVNWKLSFQSKHMRKNNTSIQLYHLFFDFVN